MTSDEIKETPQDGRTSSGWLKEIAYQLALLNDSRKPEDETKRGPERPKSK